MRVSWLATAGIALACAPCVLALLVGAGVGAGAFSAFGSAFSEPGLAIAAGFLALLLFAGAAAISVRRRGEVACEADFTPIAGVEETAGTSRVAGSYKEDPLT